MPIYKILKVNNFCIFAIRIKQHFYVLIFVKILFVKKKKNVYSRNIYSIVKHMVSGIEPGIGVLEFDAWN